MEAVTIKAYTDDVSQIEAIKAFMKALKIKFELSKEIVAYTVQGEPLTKEQYIERVQKASLGELTSTEDLEKEMQGW